MIGKLFAHLRQQWLGALAVALVLTGGTAYALDGSNTVFSDDIVNGEVRTADIRDANLTTADIRSDAVITGKIADGTIRRRRSRGGRVLPDRDRATPGHDPARAAPASVRRCSRSGVSAWARSAPTKTTAR